MSEHTRRYERSLDVVVERLRSASRVLVVTGAGMSADAGVPTYRGVGGLYQDAKTEAGISIEQALSGRMLALHPECCWQHILRIDEACRGAVPHRGHRVLAAWQQRFELCLFTQNVDGLQRAAGCRGVIDIHGNIHDIRCTRCDYRSRLASFAGLACPPLCPECNAVLRPEVVLFGEMLPAHKLSALQQQLAQGIDVAFSIGTTSVFPYVSQPLLHTRMHGGMAVEINPGETEISHLVDVRLEAGAERALVALAKRL